MHRVPPRALRRCCILIEEFIVRQCALKVARPVDHISLLEDSEVRAVLIANEAHCVIRKFVRSNPAQSSERVQVLAMLPMRIVRLGDLVGPIGAVTLG